MLGAILFDLDNTLIDRDGSVRLWIGSLLRAEGSNATAVNAELDPIMRRDASGYGDRSDFYAWMARRFACFGSSPDRVRSTMLRALRRDLKPDPQVLELLRRLRRSCRLGLVSNGGAETQRAKLDSAGLSDAFDAVLISGAIGHAKPSAAIFQRALDALGAGPGTAVCVGDHPGNDVAGAARLGMRTCWVAHGRDYPAGLPPPTWSVPHVTALPQVLPC